MSLFNAFRIWAPAESVWSQWAKPILFTQDTVLSALPSTWTPRKSPLLVLEPSTAMIVDLPGEESVWMGLELAANGYRPVPLYNSAPGPSFSIASAVVDTSSVRTALYTGAKTLSEMHIAENAPPAFLLDRRRSGATTNPSPGRFDNRSVVFPQDFPSAKFLLSQGIQRVILIPPSGTTLPTEDLAHVLLRWQEAGIRMFLFDARAGQLPPLQVQKPSRFRSLWYRALVIMGLRRHSAGGFGSIVPEPTSSGGYS